MAPADRSKKGKLWAHKGDTSYALRYVNIAEGKRVYLRLCLGEYATKDLLACQPRWHKSRA